MTATGFGSRLLAATSSRGPLCVGIDPHPSLLAQWELPDTPAGLERFALGAVEALATEVAVIKPQSAFFERHGSRGVAVLERVIERVRAAGALTILDIKRGDIGSTMVGYAEAYLADGAPLAADAVTLSPYLGLDALEPAFELAQRTGRGVFVLAKTSNPEASGLQEARCDTGRSVAQSVVEGVAARNADAGMLGNIGVVIGATLGSARLALAELRGPILAPGIGAQGATPADLPGVFGSAVNLVLPNASRSILGRGPGNTAMRAAAAQLCRQIASAGVGLGRSV